MQEQHNALGPLVCDLLLLFIADEAEHSQFVIVLRRAVIRLPIHVFAPFFESLLDLGIVFPIIFGCPGVSQHAALLGQEE